MNETHAGRYLTAALLVVLAQYAPADGHSDKRTGTTTICSKDGVERTVSVEYETSASVPCRVKYEKPDRLEYPWRAEREVGYCEIKAAYLVDRLRGFGWQCNAASGD